MANPENPRAHFAEASSNAHETAMEQHCHLAYMDFCQSPEPPEHSLEACCSSQLPAEWWAGETGMDVVQLEEVLNLMHAPASAPATPVYDPCPQPMLLQYNTSSAVIVPVESHPSPFASYSGSAAAAAAAAACMPVRTTCSATSVASIWQLAYNQPHDTSRVTSSASYHLQQDDDLDLDVALAELVSMTSQEEACAAIQMLDELSPEEAHMLCMDLEHNVAVGMLPETAFLSPHGSNYSNDFTATMTINASACTSTMPTTMPNHPHSPTLSVATASMNAHGVGVLPSRVVSEHTCTASPFIHPPVLPTGFDFGDSQTVSDLLASALSNDTTSTGTAMNTSTPKKRTRGTTRSKNAKAETATHAVPADNRAMVQAAQRKRWGAGQLHPQQAQIDALLAQAGKPCMSHPTDTPTNTKAYACTKPNSAPRPTMTATNAATTVTTAAPEPKRTATPGDDEPMSDVKAETSATAGVASPQKAARKPSNPYLAKGNALAAAVRDAAYARQGKGKLVTRRKTSGMDAVTPTSSKAAAHGNAAESVTVGSSAVTTATTPAAATAVHVGTVTTESRAGGKKRALYATVPPVAEAVPPKPPVCLVAMVVPKPPQATETSDMEGVSGRMGMHSNATTVDEAVSDAEACDAAPAAAKTKGAKPQPVTNRPPQPEGILKGVLAEARTIGGRATIHSISPQDALNVAAAVGTVASLHALSDDPLAIQELLQHTEAASIAATAVAAAAAVAEAADGALQGQDSTVAIKKPKRAKKVKRSHTTPATMGCETTPPNYTTSVVTACEAAPTIHATPTALGYEAPQDQTRHALSAAMGFGTPQQPASTTMEVPVALATALVSVNVSNDMQALSSAVSQSMAVSCSPPCQPSSALAPPPPPCSLLYPKMDMVEDDSDVMWQMINALEVGFGEAY